MLNRYFYKFIFSLAVIFSSGNAEIDYIDVPQTYWEADSIFLGLGFVVKNPKDSVVITWKKNMGSVPGELFFMVPGYTDSTKFLFHNFIDSFPNEKAIINLGCYPAGSNVVFMYVVTDSIYLIAPYFNKRLYSGQNRVGIDQYISERIGLVDYRWAVAGRVNERMCEVGFASAVKGNFYDIRFYITNVYREELDKYQVALPVASPSPDHFTGANSVTLTSATIGDPKIYYTLDGSNPTTASEHYDTPIEITKTTTIKAFAAKPGDTQWVNSGIMEKTYVRDETRSRIVSSVRVLSSGPLDCQIYSFNGRYIRSIRSTQAQLSSYTSSLSSGIYFIHYKGLARAKRIVVGR
jgi:hypothetical protein